MWLDGISILASCNDTQIIAYLIWYLSDPVLCMVIHARPLMLWDRLIGDSTNSTKFSFVSEIALLVSTSPPTSDVGPLALLGSTTWLLLLFSFISNGVKAQSNKSHVNFGANKPLIVELIGWFLSRIEMDKRPSPKAFNSGPSKTVLKSMLLRT